MPETTHLLWLDLETTGTDERIDSIVEIGCALTDLDLAVVSWYSSLVRPTPSAWDRARANEVVWDMHQASGLATEIEGQWADLPSLEDADAQARAWLADKVRSHRVMLAGSGVSHFDRRFLQMQMPRLEKHLAYPNLDIGVVRRFMAMFAPHLPEAMPAQGKTHRAMDDVWNAFQQAQHWRDALERLDYSEVE